MFSNSIGIELVKNWRFGLDENTYILAGLSNLSKGRVRMEKNKLLFIALFSISALLVLTPLIEAEQPSVDWWPMFHHDQAHTGSSTSEAPLTNQTLWKFKTGNSLEYSSPAVVNGVAYVGSQDRIFYAIDSATGKKIWSFEAGYSIKSVAAVFDNKVYFGSLDNNVYALDANTGNRVWNFATGNQVYSSPSVVDGVLYIGSNDHYVYALNAESGEKIWSFQTDNYVWSSPAVVNGVVYIASWEYVYALNAQTGSEIWTFKPDDSMYSSPSVVNGIVYFGSNNGNLYAINADNGVKVWNFTTKGYVTSSPTVQISNKSQ